MRNCERILFFIWAIISVTCAQSDQVHTYMHPHQALHKLKELESTASQLTASDVEQIKTVGETLSPMNVLRRFTENKAAVSDICFNQTLYIVESLLIGGKNNSWTLDMVDAWGKPGSGIRRLNLDWLGDFDECQSVKSSYSTDNSYTVKPMVFEGQYCGLGTVVGSTTIGFGIPTGINIGSCFPSGCSEGEISYIVTELLEDAHLNMTKGVKVECQVKNMLYSNAAIATIVLYCIMGLMCVMGTFYDFIFIMTSPPPPPQTEVSPAEDDANLSGLANIQNDADTEMLINPHESKVERTPGTLGEFLMCFSLYTNGYKLLSTKQAAGSLRCLHGIRFISLTWVILGHTLFFSMGSVENPLTLFSWMKIWSFQVIVNGTVSVDSFFVLSALLTSYLLLKELERKKRTPLKFLISVPIMYLHRYIRLTPAYGSMLLFYACLSLYTYSGPLKPTGTTIGDSFCPDYWYTNILYINNIVHPMTQCAPWGWYLSDDFQFFLVTPFVVYLMYRLPIPGMILAIAMVVTSIGTAIGASVKYDLGLDMIQGRNSSNIDLVELKHDAKDYYYAPWTRYQSFGIGVIFGFILWKCKGRLPVPRIANLCLWGLSFALMLAVLYGPFEMEAGKRVGTVAEVAMYNGFARTAWCLALGYVMLACCLGAGGWVNEFLSWPAFVPLSRMTYCAYLVHPVIMTIFSASHKNKVHWDEITLIYLFAGYAVSAYAVAFLFSLVFEAPFMLIDKKYLTGRLSKSVK